MTSYLSTVPSTSSPATKSRSLISRLRSPFATRTRTIPEFDIDLDEPHRQWSPGDLIKGNVILTVTKPVRVTHLAVCLHGYAQVFKNVNPSGEGTGVDGGQLGSGRGKRQSEYLGNGLASLFEDEVILCGEGKLDAGVYQFNFELEFPSKGLPSSIDFERGTISYKITSTLTRPTAISPTTIYSRKIYLVESIDVASLHQPKPRVITLEPIHRRSKPRKSKKLSDHGKAISSESKTGAEAAECPESASVRSSGVLEDPPQSPALSDVSSESGVGSSIGSFRIGPSPLSATSGIIGDGRSSINSLADKTITATVELLRGGCLRGDMLPLKVSIKHTKAIKSLHGIIITFYRQGRIDYHPESLLGFGGKAQNAEKAKYEDYLPKSRTGLGGLSLSSAGTSNVFRKDLSQTFAPILIDPRSLTTEVNASVRVPEDAFPTITTVPGAMISFRYFVEVVLDLGGKLAGHDRVASRLGMPNTPRSHSSESPMTARIDENRGNMITTWGGPIVETDQIRREKSVVVALFPVIVGTMDSGRKRTRRVDEQYVDGRDVMHHDLKESHTISLPPETPEQQSQGYREGNDAFAPGYNTSQSEYPCDQSHPHGPTESRDPVPPPDIPNESAIDEKTRMRRAEERLLPSSPPTGNENAALAAAAYMPSAPIMEDVDHHDLREHNHTTEGINAPNYTGPSVPRPVLAPPFMRTSGNSPEDVNLAIPPQHAPIDDKQDLERQRLQMEASGPDDFPEDDHDASEGGSSQVAVPLGPTAPGLYEDDERDLYNDRHDSHNVITGGQEYSGESLPSYQR
ncbi:MAG: ph-response sensor protein [Pycnora praestabilis]|nr:MAG: ph-response sensor protein [Pycnora praestabilis]